MAAFRTSYTFVHPCGTHAVADAHGADAVTKWHICTNT